MAAQAFAAGVIVGLERDLGVQREAVERGAQLARQGEGLRVATAASGTRLATLGLYAPALDCSGVELGEQRLLGLLELLLRASQPSRACQVAQDAALDERNRLGDVRIARRLGLVEDRTLAGVRRDLGVPREAAAKAASR